MVAIQHRTTVIPPMTRIQATQHRTTVIPPMTRIQATQHRTTVIQPMTRIQANLIPKYLILITMILSQYRTPIRSATVMPNLFRQIYVIRIRVMVSRTRQVNALKMAMRLIHANVEQIFIGMVLPVFLWLGLKMTAQTG
ncbi:hypothetical protein J5834_05640 [bacterium]|nr:hypothetical protein [bacterium]